MKSLFFWKNVFTIFEIMKEENIQTQAVLTLLAVLTATGCFL